MTKPESFASGADWTNLLKDPEIASHLGELLKVYREAAPEQRNQALVDAMRKIKSVTPKPVQTAPTPAAAAAAVPEPIETVPKTMPPFEPDLFTPNWSQDRRRYPRMKCFVAVELHISGSSSPVWGNLSNTSLGGCLVETVSPLPIGSRLEIGLWVASGKIWVKGLIIDGVVDKADPSFGVRVRFGEMEPSERESLRQFLKYVEHETKGYHKEQGYLAQLKR
jgi:hypothetical protein